MTLDYFYGQSGELFSYFRIPKALFQDSRFRQLSTDARTLYGILLDRMSLSVKNGWMDKQGRVYIIYTVREVQESLCCAEHKAVKLFRELEQIDLIERKRRGLGRPSLIYVKDFTTGLSKTHNLNCANSNSGVAQSAVQERQKPQANKTDKNKTEMNKPDPIHSEDIREQLEDYFYQVLEVELLLRLFPDDEDTIYQIVDLLVDTCATKRRMLRIAGDDKPAEVVRSRLKKLNADHIRFVLNSLAENALHPFTNHPFKVLDDEAMTRTVESIAQYGVLAPLIARPRPEGGYEIISGHRRQYAAKLAGLDTLPVIVRQMSDDAAVILMVDSNLQREHILPSERAFAYKMKLDAIKNQGARSDLTSRQVVGKLEAADEVGKATDESGRQVQRFIRLTNLVPELLDMVDEKKISFNPAVELSYLDAKQQQDFLEAMDASQNAPSLSQAIRIKKLAQQSEFSYDAVYDIMNEEKKSELDTVTIKNETLRKYFPRSYTPRQMESIIIKLLDQWQLKKQQAKQKKQEEAR
jgi:ParB family chromosome partitioning protein